MTVHLYYNPQSRAVMTLWLLEELGVSYDLKMVDYEDGSMRSEAFMALNPMGKIPVIVDGETVVTETVAIALYLADKYKDNADLAPGIDDPRRGEYLRWIVFQAASIEPAMLQAGMKFETNQRSAGWGNVQLVAKVLENRLSLANPYLFGDWFTAADLIVGGAVNWAIQFDMFPKTPALSAYAQRITERPAFQRAFATQNS